MVGGDHTLECSVASCLHSVHVYLSISTSIYDPLCYDDRCVQYGVLPHDEAGRINKIVLKRKQDIRAGIAVVASPPRPKKKKKSIKKEEPEAIGSKADI